MVFSEIIWSTCLSLKISAFFSILSATNSPDCFCFASLTLPNDPANLNQAKLPVPKVCIISKSLNLTLVALKVSIIFGLCIEVLYLTINLFKFIL
jgi:hypothetical protein